MAHKHLHLQELFETSLLNKTEHSKQIDNCDHCRTRLYKAEYLLSKLKEKEIVATEDLYKNIKGKVKTKDDFLAFIAESSYAKEKKTEAAQKQLKKFRLKYAGYAAAGLIAACLLIFMNFNYYLFLSNDDFIKASGSVSISRKGFVAGKTDLNSNMILLGKDEISNDDSDILIKTGRGMKLYIKRMSKFYFNEKNNLFSVSIFKGKYFIHFDKYYNRKWIVDLPMYSRVIVTGTQMYFNVDQDKYNVYLKEGKAELQISKNKSIKLNPGQIYTLSANKPLDSTSLSQEEEYRLLSAFIELEDFNSYIRYKDLDDKRGESFEKKGTSIKKKLTLNDLKRKYGTLSVITTKDNKRYIGAFKIMGDKIQIITTTGKVILPSSKIKNLSPYQK